MKESISRSILLVCAAGVVLLLCLLTFFVVSVGTDNFVINKFIKAFLLNLPFCLAMVYVDIMVIKYTIRFNRLSPALKLLADFVFTGAIISVMSIAANMVFANGNDFIRQIVPSLLVGCIILLCVELYTLGIRHSADSKRLLQIEKEKAKYQYEALKNQINPHFLFNCLNVIASLAYENPDKTNLFTKRLSNVYRYLLSTRTKNIVPVAEELKFTNEYAFLQQIRFEKNLNIIIVKIGEYDDKMIVPASIQMSVENAIKHNICNSANPLEIKIEVYSDYVSIKNKLNRLHGSGGTGTGIDNLREQFKSNGKDIKIAETESEYIVELPFIHLDNRP